jgi:ABC-2 type transport system ATP-binding protein
LAGRKLKGLSRGEQQRILLARALIHDPDIYLLDEPAAGLDPRGRVELRELLRLMHERGKTILISSHILSDLQEICTHLVLIDRGRVVFQGTHEELHSGGLQRCRIKIESTKSLTPIMQFLGGLEGLVLDEPGPTWIVIDAPADPAVAQDLLQQLVRRDFGIVSFERRTESLEDVYLRLTDFEADNE